MAILKLKKLAFYPTIGIYDHEQKSPNKIELNITIESCSIIPKDDNAPNIDYAELYKRIKSIVYKQKYKLIETLAIEVMRELKTNITGKITLEVCKYSKFLGEGKACIEITSEEIV